MQRDTARDSVVAIRDAEPNATDTDSPNNDGVPGMLAVLDPSYPTLNIWELPNGRRGLSHSPLLAARPPICDNRG